MLFTIYVVQNKCRLEQMLFRTNVVQNKCCLEQMLSRTNVVQNKFYKKEIFSDKIIHTKVILGLQTNAFITKNQNQQLCQQSSFRTFPRQDKCFSDKILSGVKFECFPEWIKLKPFNDIHSTLALYSLTFAIATATATAIATATATANEIAIATYFSTVLRL